MTNQRGDLGCLSTHVEDSGMHTEMKYYDCNKNAMHLVDNMFVAKSNNGY